jgi:hypothetical protein
MPEGSRYSWGHNDLGEGVEVVGEVPAHVSERGQRLRAVLDLDRPLGVLQPNVDGVEYRLMPLLQPLRTDSAACEGRLLGRHVSLRLVRPGRL